MIIRFENKWVLRAALRRWNVPTYVKASASLWLAWFIGYRAARSAVALAGYFTRERAA